MKKHMYILTLLLMSIGAFAQNEEKETRLSIEVDPAAYIFRGYSISLKYLPASLKHSTIMASVYRGELPDGMMLTENKDKGWKDLTIKTSYALFYEYYLKPERKGFYFGPSLFLYNKQVSNRNFAEQPTFQTIYPNMRIGYVWYPFKRVNLYLNPWLNIGSEINVNSRNSVNGITFEPNRLNYIMALHIGYSFKW